MTAVASTSEHLRVLSDETRAILDAKKMVFTVTTGRSGTDFLASVADLLPGVLSLHEPHLNFVDICRRVQLGLEGDLATRWWIQEKLPQIARRKRPIYFESNHVFCKGFLEPLLDLGYVPSLILLSRPSRDIAKSMFRLGTIPGRTLRADRWYLRPDDPGVLAMPGWEAMHDYQLCFWYTLEIARRQRVYQELLASHGGVCLPLTLAELNTMEGFQKLSMFVTGEEPSFMLRRRFKKLTGKPRNTKDRPKADREMVIPDDLDAMEQEVHAATGTGASECLV